MAIIDSDKLDKILMEEAVFKTKKANNNSTAEARGLIKAHDLLKKQPSICCENCKNWYDVEEQENKAKIGCCDSLYNFFNGDDIATSMKSYADDFCSYFISIKKESAN